MLPGVVGKTYLKSFFMPGSHWHLKSQKISSPKYLHSNSRQVETRVKKCESLRLTLSETFQVHDIRRDEIRSDVASGQRIVRTPPDSDSDDDRQQLLGHGDHDRGKALEPRLGRRGTGKFRIRFRNRFGQQRPPPDPEPGGQSGFPLQP